MTPHFWLLTGTVVSRYRPSSLPDKSKEMRSTTIRNNTFDLWWTWISILFIIPATRLIKCNGLALSPDLRKRIELKTTAKNPFASQVALQDFLVRPVHWPLIVASSDSVKPVLSPQANRNSDWVETLSRGRRVAPSSAIDVSTPLEVGQSVEEVFGLGLLKVRWTCKYSTLDRLLVVSPKEYLELPRTAAWTLILLTMPQ